MGCFGGVYSRWGVLGECTVGGVFWGVTVGGVFWGSVQ